MGANEVRNMAQIYNIKKLIKLLEKVKNKETICLECGSCNNEFQESVSFDEISDTWERQCQCNNDE